MAGYALLFSVEVVHGYFHDPARLGLTFRPDTATQAWLARTGAVVRSAANVLRVHYETTGPGGGRSLAQTGEAVELRFGVNAVDATFAAFTDGLGEIEAEPICFRGGADPGPDDVRPLEQRDPPGPPAPWRGGPRPDFAVAVPLTGDLSDAGRAYRLTLESRATIWKYILTDGWKAFGPSIVDGDKGVDFEPPVEEPMADGRTAIAIRSRAPIPLAERPNRQFRLVATAEGSAPGRTLIERLPGPRPGVFGRDPAGGASSPISEIYVEPSNPSRSSSWRS